MFKEKKANSYFITLICKRAITVLFRLFCSDTSPFLLYGGIKWVLNMTFYSAHSGRWYSIARPRIPFFHHAIFLGIFQHDKARQTISCYKLIIDSILSDRFRHVKVLCSLATSTILDNYRFYETNILDGTDIPF